MILSLYEALRLLNKQFGRIALNNFYVITRIEQATIQMSLIYLYQARSE